jgi:hypothetical protein
MIPANPIAPNLVKPIIDQTIRAPAKLPIGILDCKKEPHASSGFRQSRRLVEEPVSHAHHWRV